MRKVCAEAGDIAYDNGRPVCFHACILRRLYLAQEEIIGKVGGMTCIWEDADVSALMDVRAVGFDTNVAEMVKYGHGNEG